MELKRYNIEPTDENVLDSFLRDVTGRNAELYAFLEIIGHDSVSSLALNGDWGSGKTFFVKQAALLMEFMSPKPNLDAEIRLKLEKFYESGRGSHNQRPRITPCRVVYYDAWLYDDHEDPIQSLLYFLSVTLKKKYGRQQPEATRIFSAIVKTLAKWKGADFDALVEPFQTEDASATIQTLEEMKLSLQEAFNDLLEDIYTLVIFVDELDRCKPTYAIRFLERIKHFFNCPKVKFVFATNMRQLEVSIKRFYGNEFESTKYLNKFFDFTIELPPVSLPRYLNEQSYPIDKDYYHSLCIYLSSYFRFSLRDLNTFLGLTESLGEKVIRQVESYSQRSTSQAFSYLFFPPTLVALDISSRADYIKVVTGKGEHIILDIFEGWSDGVQLAAMTLSGTLNCKPADILNIISKLYLEIFKRHGYTTNSNESNQRSVILKLISKL